MWDTHTPPPPPTPRWGVAEPRSPHSIAPNSTLFICLSKGHKRVLLITDLIALCSEKCQRQNIESELRLGTNLAYQPTSE